MLGMLLTVPVMLCLALLPQLWAMAIAAFVLGVGFDIFGISWETALGQHVPIDKLSRVSSYDMLGSFIAGPVGQLTVGYVAVAISAKAVELYGAALFVLITLITLVVPSVWNLRRVDV